MTTNVYCWHSVPVAKTASNEQVQVVPGVEGPKRLRWDDERFVSRQGGGMTVSLRLEYEEALRRYVCTELQVHRSPDASEGKGFLTSEALPAFHLGPLGLGWH